MNRVIAKRSYSAEDVDRALSAAVYFNGDTRRASEALEAQGLKVARSTLRDWVTHTNRDRYVELRDKELAGIHAAAAEKHQALVDANMETEAAIVQRLRAEIDTLPARDLSAAARNAAVAAGVHQDKNLTLTGKGTTPVVSLPLPDLIRSIAAHSAPGGPSKFTDAAGNPLTADQAVALSRGESIDSTAEELTEKT